MELTSEGCYHLSTVANFLLFFKFNFSDNPFNYFFEFGIWPLLFFIHSINWIQ